jgi:hypothetical protein
MGWYERENRKRRRANDRAIREKRITRGNVYCGVVVDHQYLAACGSWGPGRLARTERHSDGVTVPSFWYVDRDYISQNEQHWVKLRDGDGREGWVQVNRLTYFECVQRPGCEGLWWDLRTAAL